MGLWWAAQGVINPVGFIRETGHTSPEGLLDVDVCCVAVFQVAEGIVSEEARQVKKAGLLRRILLA